MERLKQLWITENRDVVLDGNRYIEIGYTTYDVAIYLFRENEQTVFSVGSLRYILKEGHIFSAHGYALKVNKEFVKMTVQEIERFIRKKRA